MTVTYVLRSDADGTWHMGSAGDLRARLKQQDEGRMRSTAGRRPLRRGYYEAGVGPVGALRRERLLKTGNGKRFLRSRLAGFFSRLRDTRLERH